MEKQDIKEAIKDLVSICKSMIDSLVGFGFEVGGIAITFEPSSVGEPHRRVGISVDKLNVCESELCRVGETRDGWYSMAAEIYCYTDSVRDEILVRMSNKKEEGVYQFVCLSRYGEVHVEAPEGEADESWLLFKSEDGKDEESWIGLTSVNTIANVLKPKRPVYEDACNIRDVNFIGKWIKSISIGDLKSICSCLVSTFEEYVSGDISESYNDNSAYSLVNIILYHNRDKHKGVLHFVKKASIRVYGLTGYTFPEAIREFIEKVKIDLYNMSEVIYKVHGIDIVETYLKNLPDLKSNSLMDLADAISGD